MVLVDHKKLVIIVCFSLSSPRNSPEPPWSQFATWRGPGPARPPGRVVTSLTSLTSPHPDHQPGGGVCEPLTSGQRSGSDTWLLVIYSIITKTPASHCSSFRNIDSPWFMFPHTPGLVSIPGPGGKQSF